ncbi:LLM class flavin-dependent oxidoreductase [Streptomyces paludis]|uniref:LLM class flavin-dependent oxidoreductase n=1 Tax=Streptomyces paludis TaxID=2282738 RepID=A0A345HLX7_9ACTN|nr:LLM class flavin-dependent oxidoreductase [Streptomyces paludis]AXG77701.1 LLM class flavin-dependent oxidoreductase [Streptomyces paludis]
MRLSVLDLLSVRTNQTSAEVLRSSAQLAREADRLGYTRYWVAEHHNMPTAAATVPGVIIPYLAAGTRRLRFGSGGVMLPNHAALSVAEQFALLEAMYPGRIDLGIGRAPGTDGVTAFLLRGEGSGSGSDDDFPQDIELVSRLLDLGRTEDEALNVSLGGRPYALRATPRPASAPDIWLLGSSGYSASLAARRGLPYVFAHHTGVPGAEASITAYRAQYQPSTAHPEPRTLLPVNVLVHPDPDEAERLAQPHLIMMAGLQTGAPLGPVLTVEEAERHVWSAQEREVAKRTRGAWHIGTPETVAESLRQLAHRLDIDELMVWPISGARSNEDPASAGGRALTLQLLAQEFLGTSTTKKQS